MVTEYKAHHYNSLGRIKDLPLIEAIHCSLARLAGAGVGFTAVPQEQRPLLAVEQHYSSS